MDINIKNYILIAHTSILAFSYTSIKRISKVIIKGEDSPLDLDTNEVILLGNLTLGKKKFQIDLLKETCMHKK